MLCYKKAIKNAFMAMSLTVLLGCQPTPVYRETPNETSIEPVTSVTNYESSSMDVNIYFPFAQWTITPQNRTLLNNVAIAMLDSRLADYNFIIQGHTDIVGRLGSNLALSQLRAVAVMDYLINQGVKPDRLSAQGFGYLRLKDSDNPRSSVNRRVEFLAYKY